MSKETQTEADVMVHERAEIMIVASKNIFIEEKVLWKDANVGSWINLWVLNNSKEMVNGLFLKHSAKKTMISSITTSVLRKIIFLPFGEIKFSLQAD